MIPRLTFTFAAAVTVAAWIHFGARLSADTLTVNTTDDLFDGSCDATHCSLMEAVIATYATPGPDVIGFNIPGPGVKTIRPRQWLPILFGDTTIDGFTQPGSRPNSLAVGSDAIMLIEIAGDLNVFSGDPFQAGLTINGNNNVVRGLVINRFSKTTVIGIPGITLVGNNNVIEGNYIGTDPTGALDLGNGSQGILVAGGANNRIGGPAPASRNVISGQGVLGSGTSANGVAITSGLGPATTNTLVVNNYIGTDATGALPLPNSDSGIVAGSGTGHVVQGNVIAAHPGNGMLFGGISGNATIDGNFIGTSATGTAAIGNAAGIALEIQAPGTTIAVTGNVLSASTGNCGLVVFSGPASLVVQRNRIGTDITGTLDLGNVCGINLGAATGSTVLVGGVTPGSGNVISGNDLFGMSIFAGGNPDIRVVGNLIGTRADGISPLGNGGIGVHVFGSAQIGSPAAGNVIAFNGDDGVVVQYSGGPVPATGATIRGNQVFANTRLGIDLFQEIHVPCPEDGSPCPPPPPNPANDGVSPNDPGDADAGPNGTQNFPVLTTATATGAATSLSGTLNSTPLATFVIDFYASASCDPSGHGEGETYLGFEAGVTTDVAGDASFITTIAPGAPAGSAITATATDAAGHTSEFSACIVATPPAGGGGAAPVNINGVLPPGAIIPGGVGPFAGFPLGPIAIAGSVGFAATGNNGQAGLYAASSATGVLVDIVDVGTPLPGGNGSFSSFGGLALAPLTPGDPCHRAAFIGLAQDGTQGFYGSALQPGDPCNTLRVIADLATPIPAGTGMFTALRDPVIGSSGVPSPIQVGLIGDGSGGQSGVYVSENGLPPTTVASTTSAIPGGVGTFAGFRDLSIADTSNQGVPTPPVFAFVGTGATAQQGIYVAASPGTAIQRIADSTTPIPDGTGAFTGFHQPAFAQDVSVTSPAQMAFIGEGSNGQRGVYLGAATGGSTVTRIADLTTPIPDGHGTFTGFAAVSASGGHVAFLATGADGQKGIYVASTLSKVIDLDDSLDGKALTDIRFGRQGLLSNTIAVAVTFADGSEGLYVVTLDFADENDAPSAAGDSYTTDEDVTLAVPAPGVLANDLDPEGGPLTASLLMAPSNGTVTMNPDGSFSYTPGSNFNGADAFAYKAIDAAGRDSAFATVHITVTAVDRDVTAPTTHAAPSSPPNANGWHKRNVTVTLMAADDVDGSGVQEIAYRATGAHPIAPTTVAGASATLKITAEGETIVVFSARDRAGNLEADRTLTIRLDKTAPVISIDVPRPFAKVLLHQPVAAQYSCSDAVSAVDVCAGPVAPGSPLDTSRVGPSIFRVHATDLAGNPAHEVRVYWTSYRFVGFLHPVANWPAVNEVLAGKTYPIAWQLTDAAGAYVRSLNSVVGLFSWPVACTADQPAIIGKGIAIARGAVRFDTLSNQFVFDWRTERSWRGCRQLQLVLKDGSTHAVKVRFK